MSFKLTQSGQEIQQDLNIIENTMLHNAASAGQVLTANGTGTASFQNIKTGLVFTDVVADSWVPDSTYIGYAFKCAIPCQGIADTAVVEVIFDVAEATSGRYAPFCVSGTNTVTIYSTSNISITIPVIKEIL